MPPPSAAEVLREYLQARDLRPTRERLLILDEVLKMGGHFDADEFYGALHRKKLKVSRATVYNTLELLVDSGLISRLKFGQNSWRFEKAYGRPRHDHMICLECGEIIEFVAEKLEPIQEEVCKAKRFKPQNSTLQIFGTCSRCAK
jgi:Fur family ferric uptake transcriptional regulator